MQRHFLFRLWFWWTRELIGLLPRQVVRVWNSNLFNYAIHSTNNTWCVTSRGLPFGIKANVAQGAWPDIQDTTVTHIRSRVIFADTTVSVSLDDCLQRIIEIPREARSSFEEIASMDLSQATPFDKSNAFVGNHLKQTPQRGWCIHQIVLKRSKVDHVVKALKRSRISVERIVVRDTQGRAVSSFDPGSSIKTIRPDRVLAMLLCVFSIGLIGLSMFITVQHVHRQQQTLADIDQRITTLRRQTAKAKDRIISTQRSHALARLPIKRHQTQASPLEILATLTEALPDTAWVREFRIDDDKLYLTGFGKQPEELIALLSEPELFGEARFTAPLARSASGNQERFQLLVSLADKTRSIDQTKAKRQ